MRERLRSAAVAVGLGAMLVMAGAGCSHRQPLSALPPPPPSPQATAVLQQGIASVNATPGLSDAEKARRIAVLQRQFGGGNP